MATKADEILAMLVACPRCGMKIGFTCLHTRDFFPLRLKHPHRARIEAGKKFVAEKGVDHAKQS